jgi:hypothetical protein
MFYTFIIVFTLTYGDLPDVQQVLVDSTYLTQARCVQERDAVMAELAPYIDADNVINGHCIPTPRTGHAQR